MWSSLNLSYPFKTFSQRSVLKEADLPSGRERESLTCIDKIREKEGILIQTVNRREISVKNTELNILG